MDDTNRNAPESLETLRIQQRQLVAGKRAVQMFPTGTHELKLPSGFHRHKTGRGVFHYNPSLITPALLDKLSRTGRENEFLQLGPYSKPDITNRLRRGEALRFVTEYSPAGVEIRSALGTDRTIGEQRAYFKSTKEPNSAIMVGLPPRRVEAAMRKARGYGRANSR